MGTRTWPSDQDAIFWGKDVVEDDSPAPASIRLGESYPNPLLLRSGLRSQIALEVESERTLGLHLHDALGREVARVYEGRLPAGRHVLGLDASALRPGMYFYVLRGTDLLLSRGLVIVR